ncbi:hypothetical protein GXW83_21035 [Streptacidiphilus sp. PB12-B1b]|uniref:hypothetical protein n=1 Tax=Streptacidiphilus sp. PB12-B1b TaxID=2705012 RepID=UPI0015FD700B|nr:hypothetical protein [Streptacidiphilus sp. PB12-B1b]QMU77803.1 hypothetical protein GXW83_21035 [Streptacidiphilus sp. PB12-B1b]
MNRPALARAGYGLLQLACAPVVFRRTKDATALRTIQVLGARQLVQAAVTAPAPTGAVLALGVEVDLLHAASMLALAAVAPRWRGLALWEAGAAAALAGGAAAAARQLPPARRLGSGAATGGGLVALRDRCARTLARRTVAAPLGAQPG